MRFLGLLILALSIAPAIAQQRIELRVGYGVPSSYEVGVNADIKRRMMDAFYERYPNIHVESSLGMHMPGGSRTQDLIPFMQIAGDIAPDVLFVNFRQSQT